MLRLLALSPVPPEGAGCRFRVMQYMPALEQAGVSVTVAPFFDAAFFDLRVPPRPSCKEAGGISAPERSAAHAAAVERAVRRVFRLSRGIPLRSGALRDGAVAHRPSAAHLRFRRCHLLEQQQRGESFRVGTEVSAEGPRDHSAECAGAGRQRVPGGLCAPVQPVSCRASDVRGYERLRPSEEPTPVNCAAGRRLDRNADDRGVPQATRGVARPPRVAACVRSSGERQRRHNRVSRRQDGERAVVARSRGRAVQHLRHRRLSLDRRRVGEREVRIQGDPIHGVRRAGRRR